jgi:hypothetical protein
MHASTYLLISGINIGINIKKASIRIINTRGKGGFLIAYSYSYSATYYY